MNENPVEKDNVVIWAAIAIVVMVWAGSLCYAVGHLLKALGVL